MATTVGGKPGRARLPVRSRDRRPALAALALLLVVGGGLGAGLIVYRTGQQVDVLAASHTIHPGDTLSADDLTTVRISGASNNTIADSSRRNFIGTVAVTTIPSGTLLIRDMFHTRKGLVPASGQEVGISLSAAQLPAQPLVPGDVVTAYYVTKGTSTDTAPPAATPLAQAVLVTDVKASGTDGSTVVTVLVATTTDSTGTTSDAGKLVAAANLGDVSLTRLPVGTKPQLSLAGG